MTTSKCFIGLDLVSRLNDMEAAMDSSAGNKPLPTTTDYRKRVDDFMAFDPAITAADPWHTGVGYKQPEPVCALDEPFVQPGDQALLDFLVRRKAEVLDRWEGAKVRIIRGRHAGRVGTIASVEAHTGYRPGWFVDVMDDPDLLPLHHIPVADIEKIA